MEGNGDINENQIPDNKIKFIYILLKKKLEKNEEDGGQW